MNAFPASPWLTLGLCLASLGMFAACMGSARKLIGWPAACGFAALALPLGWLAEQMGASHGWFFGRYHYTNVLGPKLGDVPLAIPLMWFAFIWLGLVMANLLLWRTPIPEPLDWPKRVLTAFLGAMIVTAFDLGADPYFVYVIHAWIMQKTDGGWFGETLQGFVGWMVVSFTILLLVQVLVRPRLSDKPAPQLRKAALVPVGIYAAGLIFQLLFGSPIEVRAIAFFAMGIPLLISLAAWWPWQPHASSSPAPLPQWPCKEMIAKADPLADDTIARIVGPWSDDAGAMGPGIARVGQANRCAGQWAANGSLTTWEPSEAGSDPAIAQALRTYLQSGSQLPAWADAAKVARAETLFMEQGPLSCTLLFCASLPQCYVLPQLAEVLHIAGNLEAHTEHRIRQTAAMIFPVMMRGGLMDAQGNGVAQVLKVRLVHATIRHFILHGNPSAASVAIAPNPVNPPAAQALSMPAALMAHGWSPATRGMPCSQFELAYTLLTFGYVFLQGMRTLGLRLPQQDEEAYLHLWNVMGHVLGLDEALMAHTMDEASALFAQMQTLGCSMAVQPDPRPALGHALVSAMARTIRLPVVRSIPVPMTRWLMGQTAAQAIGLGQRVSLPARALFAVGRAVTGCIDGIARLALPQFSISRMLTRVIGYHMLSRFLLDQTRPIGLPEQVLNPLHDTVASWHQDAQAPRWMNWLEDRLTTSGHWQALANKT